MPGLRALEFGFHGLEGLAGGEDGFAALEGVLVERRDRWEVVSVVPLPKTWWLLFTLQQGRVKRGGFKLLDITANYGGDGRR